MQYEDGATVSFSMVAFTEKLCERQIRVFGPLGEITCDMSEMRVRHVDFKDGQGCKFYTNLRIRKVTNNPRPKNLKMFSL